MGMLDHWQPILPSRSLKREPVGVRLASQDIVLFRTMAGQVGAFDDMCPHRRMRLSLGRVLGDELQCKYHGWTFDCAGNGKSPGTPRLHASVRAFAALERDDYIWLKSARSAATPPVFDVDGWCRMCSVDHLVKAPLELALDNFTEVEHTPLTHQLFGFQFEHIKDVTIECTSTDGTVSFTGIGPAKRFSAAMRFLLGVGRDYLFHDVWTTHFSPVYTVFDHFWTDPATGREALVKWRVYVFFVPVDEKQTRIVAFVYALSKWPYGPYGGLRLFRGFSRRQIDREFKLDIALIEGLASHDTGLKGMKLSRFDRTLGLNRERIERVYRGNDNGAAEPSLKIVGVE